MPRYAYYTYSHRATWPKRQPTETQAKVLAFVKDEISSGRGWPTTLAIAKYMGWAGHSTAHDVLHGLCLRGHVRRNGFVNGRMVRWELIDPDVVAPAESDDAGGHETPRGFCNGLES